MSRGSVGGGKIERQLHSPAERRGTARPSSGLRDGLARVRLSADAGTSWMYSEEGELDLNLTG